MLAGMLSWLDSHINLEATAGRITGLSLDRMLSLSSLLGDPQHNYNVIHITGTNGKGSTAWLLSRLLVAQGLKVGTYSSPHVNRINERLCLNCQPIEDQQLAEVLGCLRVAEEHASYRDSALAPEHDHQAVTHSADPYPEVTYSWFELLTGAAFLWFSNEGVDVAVVEVGKLGRYDATNIVNSQIAVATNVSDDHTDGNKGWREAIAWEKAGIVSPTATLVLGDMSLSRRPTSNQHINNQATNTTEASDEVVSRIFEAEKPERTLRYGTDVVLESNQLAVGGRLLDILTPKAEYREVFLSLHGEHQGINAAVALLSAEAFFDAPINPEVVEEAFGEVILPARLEVLSNAPLVILDGAHNPCGLEAAAKTVREDFAVSGKKVLVLGMTQGHMPAEALGILLETLDTQAEEAQDAEELLIICCTAPSPRGIPARELANIVKELGIVKDLGYAIEVIDQVGDGLKRAVELAKEDGLVFVTGSLYVAGAARQQELEPATTPENQT